MAHSRSPWAQEKGFFAKNVFLINDQVGGPSYRFELLNQKTILNQKSFFQSAPTNQFGQPIGKMIEIWGGRKNLGCRSVRFVTAQTDCSPRAQYTVLYTRQTSPRRLGDVGETSGRRLGVVWESSGSRLGVVWEWSGRRLGVVWESSGSRPGVVWESSGSRLGVVWESSGRHLGDGNGLGEIRWHSPQNRWNLVKFT